MHQQSLCQATSRVKAFLNIPADNWGHFESEEPTDLPFPSNEGVSSLMTEECDRLESLLVNKSNGQSRPATTNISLIMPSVTNFVNQLDDMLGITLEVSLSTSKQPAVPMRPINPTTRARTKGFSAPLRRQSQGSCIWCCIPALALITQRGFVRMEASGGLLIGSESLQCRSRPLFRTRSLNWSDVRFGFRTTMPRHYLVR
jgi:hypothetical protein